MNGEDMRGIRISLGNINSSFIDSIVPRLDRIAVALEVVAADVSEQRERRQRGLVAEHARLTAARDRAVEKLAEAGDDSFWQDALGDSQDELDWFVATYPEIVALVEAERAVSS